MRIYKKLIAVALAMLMAGGVKAQTSTSAYYDYEVECLGVELDGSQTVRVWGVGRNKKDAVEQAKKNAVWAVIFDGIKDGAEGCNMRPLITEVNAKERYEDYFNIFFTDNGAYKDYVSVRDTKLRSGGRSKDKLGYSYDITIRVLRPQLKARLKSDNLID